MLLNLLSTITRSKSRLFSTRPISSHSSEAAPSCASLLKKCKSLVDARCLHQQIIKRGLLNFHTGSSTTAISMTNPPLGTSIIGAYLACGSPSDALSLLERLSPSPVLYWNMLIQEDVKLGHLNHAFRHCRQMQRIGVRPDHFTFPFVLKACGELPSFRRGTSIHAIICTSGFESNVYVCNALVAMYARCCAYEEAEHVFQEITFRGIDDVISWNSMVAAHVKSGYPHLALGLFSQMMNARSTSGSPQRSDVISLVNVLPACASLQASSQAKQIHCYATKTNLLSDLFVGNAVIDVYAKCGMMDDAVLVFEGMKLKDVVTWNAMVTGFSQNGDFDNALKIFIKMSKEDIALNVVTWSAVIAGYAQRGHGHDALEVFRQMQHSGSEPNAVTMISLLSACASVGALLPGMETHAYALKRWLMVCNDDDGEAEDLMVHNALIDMYCKCKNFDKARKIFDSVPLTLRTVVTWTVMIGGYSQHGDANAALELFSQMLLQGGLAYPNAFTISCVLMACARLSALRCGKQIHTYVIRNRYEAAILFVANCLIDMYSKCGDIDAAQRTFDIMREKNGVSWTSLMTGYGMHGRGSNAIQVFKDMQKAGFVPDGITFLVVLYACSHSGMIDAGLEYFYNMEKDYGVAPGAEHYACLIDLLGRAGRLNEAQEKIDNMPMEPTSVVWVSLLSACRIHNNVELGEYASQQLLKLESENDGSYTLLSNIYANAKRWRDVARIRSLMRKSGIRKRPGCSWIQSKKGTTSFFVGDRTHPQSEQIYTLLADLIERIRAMGYVPQTSCALHDVDDEEKSSLLSEHSEKLALSYGVLTTSPGMPIRITKNLRVCDDCHSAITYISRIVAHEIILRDSSRFHHFKNGSCSCGGYW